jgi:formylglycine-generating enzyme required for sulfatase activity
MKKSGFVFILIITITLLSSFLFNEIRNSPLPVIEPTNPDKPAGMILIPGGSFIEFRKYKSDKISLSHEIDSFWMSQEVNVVEYQSYLEMIKRDSGSVAYERALPDYDAFKSEHIRISKPGKVSAEEYFSSPEFAMYPIVCINWYQARAFCDWKTKIENEFRKSMQMELLSSERAYRLPNQKEWEYAAHLEVSPNKGNHYGKPDITETYDGEPNNYGLIHMLDNVGEWTSSPFSEVNWCIPESYNEDQTESMKVIKEGYAVGKGEPKVAEEAEGSRVWLGFRYVRGI